MVYVYMAYVQNNHYKLGDSWVVTICLFIFVVFIAYVLMRFYDIPLRKWLQNRHQ